MTIEIIKKSLIQAIIIIVVLGIAIYGGYSFGYDSGYSDGVEKTTRKYENPKGDGEHFYSETVTESRGNMNGFPINHSYMIYHSTPNCKAIENGVAMDRAFTPVNSAKTFPHYPNINNYFDVDDVCSDYQKDALYYGASRIKGVTITETSVMLSLTLMN